MAVPYFNVKDKDGAPTKLPTAVFDSANYPYNVSYDPALAAKLGMNSEEAAVSIVGYHALASVVASASLIGDTFGVSASSFAAGGFIPRVTATAGVLASAGSSDNTDDVPAGAGVLTVKVTGIGPAFALQYGTCTVSGTTAQPLLALAAGATATAKWIGINKAEVDTAGASASNVGNVFVGYGAFTTGVPASQMMGIAAGNSLSKQGTFIVPASKTLYLKDMTYRLSAAGSIVLQYYDMSVSGGGIVKKIRLATGAAAVEDATVNFNYSISIPEKSRVEIVGYGASGSILIDCVVNGYLKNNV